MKTMFMGFAFVLIGIAMHLGVFIMVAEILPQMAFDAPQGRFQAAVDMLGINGTLRTAHVLTIGGLVIMMLEPLVDLIARLKNRQRPKQ